MESKATFDRIVRLGAFALASSVVVPLASAQWMKNPALAEYDIGHSVVVPMKGGVAAIGDDFSVYRLDSKGKPVDVEQLAECQDDGTVSGVVGCSLGPNEFALAYRKGVDKDSPIRVAMYHYDGGDYVADVAPMTVGHGKDISIAPNLQSGGSIDGVVLAWQHDFDVEVGTTGLMAPIHEVHQQGVDSGGTLIWKGDNAAEGAVVLTENSFSLSIFDTPTVISDGQGLAIVTYRDRRHEVDDGEFYEDRVHYTTKLDSLGSPFFSCEVPGQHGNSPGDCVVTRDGAGGAFYGFANDLGTTETRLVAANVRSKDDKHYREFLTSAPASPKLRPLAAVPTGNQTFVLAYRDLEGMRSICFGAGPGVPDVWTTFLQGATADNSEEVDGILGPSYAALAWTSGNRVVTKGLDVLDGHEIFGANNEVQLNGYSPNHAVVQPQHPRIVPTKIACGYFDAGFIVEWDDQRPLAERVNDGGYLAPPCFGEFAPFGSGLLGSAGIPTLGGTALPFIGTTPSIVVDHIAPTAPIVMLVGLGATAIPLYGGTLYVAPPWILTLTLLSGGDGSMTLPISIPNNPAFIGLNAFFQGVVLDPGVAHGLALTNGLRMEIGGG